MLFQVILEIIQGHFTLNYYELFHLKYNNLNFLNI
jgi:hypothetical protein